MRCIKCFKKMPKQLTLNNKVSKIDYCDSCFKKLKTQLKIGTNIRKDGFRGKLSGNKSVSKAKRYWPGSK